MDLIPLTHDELCQIAWRFLQNNGFKVAFHDRFRAWTPYGEQADAIGFRNGASCLIEAKCSRSDLLADRKKPFRIEPDKGMGDWRFMISEPGIVNVEDLPSGWGLLHVTKGRVKKVHGWPGNGLWVNRDSKPFQANKQAECDYMFSALRRMDLRGHLKEVYDGGNLGYTMADAVKVIDVAIAAHNEEPVAYMTYKGYLLHAGDPKVSEYSEPTPLYTATPAPVVPDEMYWQDAPVEGSTRAAAYATGWNACRAAMLQAGNSPVSPDGWVMVPMRLTAENGAKGLLSGEFSETKFINCPECFGDDECETCDGSGRIEITVPVTWTTIKEIWAKGIEHFAAAPKQENVCHSMG